MATPADDLVEPVPGMLVGGRIQASRTGGAAANIPSDLPARLYVDHLRSYASNEIAINWNAPLVYLAAGLEAALEQR